MKLYEINAEMRKLAEMIESYADENDGVVNEVFEAELDGLALDRDQKIANICYLLKEWRAEEKALAEEKRYIEKRRKAVEARMERLKAYLAMNLDVGEKWKGQAGSIYWGTTETIEATNIDLVPDIYIKKELANKRELMLDLKNGADVKGVEIVVNNHLVVR
jgi:hypothetical protein